MRHAGPKTVLNTSNLSPLITKYLKSRWKVRRTIRYSYYT